MTALRDLAFLMVFTLLIVGCEESFSPKVTFQRTPILYCVLRADQTRAPDTQRVIISATYDVDGFDPALNRTDPTIRGALVELQVNSRRYDMTESSIPRSDTSRYTTPQFFYQHTAVPLYPFDTVAITAVLPDGTLLSAHSTVPSPKGIQTYPQIPPQGFSAAIDRVILGSSFVIDWEDGVPEEHLFFPMLTITYKVRTPLGDIGKAKKVPLRYVQSEGARVPVFPTYQTQKACIYALDAIDDAMREISSGDQRKGRYIITGMGFSLTEFDFPLSRFYASVNGYLDQYSVRLDESVFTNVRGGIGIFGARMDSQYIFAVDKNYVESFGYLSPG